MPQQLTSPEMEFGRKYRFPFWQFNGLYLLLATMAYCSDLSGNCSR